MNRRLNLFVAATLLSGCAGARVDRLETQIVKLEQELSDIRNTLADQGASITGVREEVGKITGKVEEVQYAQKGKTEELEESLRRMSSRVPPPPGVPEDLLSADDDMIAKIDDPAAELFRQGLQQIRTGEFEAARGTFARFTDENPRTAFTDNGFFWQGVAYERLGQMDRAVASYSEAFQRFPGEDRVPAALYQLAKVFLAMKQRSDAVLTLQKLTDEHPGSEYGRKGRELLAQLSPKSAPSKAAPIKKKR